MEAMIASDDRWPLTGTEGIVTTGGKYLDGPCNSRSFVAVLKAPPAIEALTRDWYTEARDLHLQYSPRSSPKIDH